MKLVRGCSTWLSVATLCSYKRGLWILSKPTQLVVLTTISCLIISLQWNSEWNCKRKPELREDSDQDWPPCIVIVWRWKPVCKHRDPRGFCQPKSGISSQATTAQINTLSDLICTGFCWLCGECQRDNCCINHLLEKLSRHITTSYMCRIRSDLFTIQGW